MCYVWADDGAAGGWSAGRTKVNRRLADDHHYDLFPIFPQGELHKLGVVSTGRWVSACFDEVNLANLAGSRHTIAQLLTSATRKQTLHATQRRTTMR